MADVLAPPPWNLENVVQAARERLDDLPGDVVEDEDWKSDDDGLLWTNSELAQWADEAQQEVARRRPIKDAVTQAVCQITVTTPTATYAYHKSILGIEEAYFVKTADSTHWPLVKYTHSNMEVDYPSWRADTIGDPTIYIEDLSERSITLYRPPSASGVLHLVARRLPLYRLNWTTARNRPLEIDAEHHYDLLDWMLYRAYAKDDPETRDDARAQRHFELFTLAIGERPSARIERLRRLERNTYRRTRAHFF